MKSMMERTMVCLVFIGLTSGIYSQECPFLSVPGSPKMYQQLIHGRYIERMCAPGTNFDPVQCLCSMHTVRQSGFSGLMPYEVAIHSGHNLKPSIGGTSFLTPHRRTVPNMSSLSSIFTIGSSDTQPNLMFSPLPDINIAKHSPWRDNQLEGERHPSHFDKRAEQNFAVSRDMRQSFPGLSHELTTSKKKPTHNVLKEHMFESRQILPPPSLIEAIRRNEATNDLQSKNQNHVRVQTRKVPQTEFTKPQTSKLSTLSSSSQQFHPNTKKTSTALSVDKGNKKTDQMSPMMRMEFFRMIFGNGESESQSESSSSMSNRPSASNMEAMLRAMNSGMAPGTGNGGLPTPKSLRKSQSSLDNPSQVGHSSMGGGFPDMAHLLGMMQGTGSNPGSNTGTQSMTSMLQKMSGSGTGNFDTPNRQSTDPMSNLFGMGMGMGMGGMGLSAMSEPGEGPDRSMNERMGMGDAGDQMGSHINMQLLRQMGIGNSGNMGGMGNMAGLGNMGGMGNMPGMTGMGIF